MSLIFSRQCEYALQAVLYLALRPKGGLTSAKELTGALHIPYHFLGKILQGLSRKGILESKKGPTGGFALRRGPGEITLLEVVEAIDGTLFQEECVMGFPKCSEAQPCAVHDSWKCLREGIVNMLESKSIAELATGMKKPAYLRAAL